MLVGTVSVAAVYALGRALGGVRLAQLAALLVAINPGHIYLSQEFRVYVLMFLVSALMLLAVWRYRASGSYAALLAYVIAASLGMYLHYYVALGVCAVNLWMLHAWRERALFLRWCGAQLLALVLILPALHMALGHAAARVHADGGGAASKLHLLATPLTLVYGRTLAWKVDGAAVFAVCVLLAVAVIAIALWYGFRQRFMARGFLAVAVVVPLVVVTLLATMADMQSWDDRKALAILAPVLLLLAQGLLAMPRLARGVALSLLVAGSALSWARYLHTDNRDDWRSLSRALSAQLQTGDAVVVMPDFELISLARYGGTASRAGGPATPTWGYSSVGDFVLLGQLGLQARGTGLPPDLGAARRIWLVRNRLMAGTDAEPVLRSLGVSSAARAFEQAAPRSLEIARYDRP